MDRYSPHAISQLRYSSHTLQIERGGILNPKPLSVNDYTFYANRFKMSRILGLHVVLNNVKEIYFKISLFKIPRVSLHIFIHF